MSVRTTPRSAATSVLMLALLAGEAAAGKYCGDPIESGRASGATQEEALIAAQRWWSSRAGALGNGYEHWDNAADQSMDCTQDGQGTFHCKASGRPCLPDGTLPDNLPKLDL